MLKIRKCYYCNHNIKGILDTYNCHYCNKIHCTKHRLPEEHNCIGLEKHKIEVKKRWKEVLTERTSEYDNLDSPIDWYDYEEKPLTLLMKVKRQFKKLISIFL